MTGVLFLFSIGSRKYEIRNKKPGYSCLVSCALYLIFCSLTLSGQTLVQDDLQRKITMYNVNGKLFLNPYIDVAGTPFLRQEWRYGKIKTNDNSVFTHVRVRLNLQSQEVHYLQADSVEMVLPAGMVREITVFDSAGNRPDTLTFQCGFPSVNGQDEKSFYQVLCSGRIIFLKSLRKTIHEDKDGLSGEVRKEFREYEDYYFFVPDKLERIKRDKMYILGFMKDRNAPVEEFLQKNKISFKSPDDVKKLVDYYNSLF